MRVRAVVTRRTPTTYPPALRHPPCSRRPRARILFESDRSVIDAVHAQISFTRKGLSPSLSLTHPLCVSPSLSLSHALSACLSLWHTLSRRELAAKCFDGCARFLPIVDVHTHTLTISETCVCVCVCGVRNLRPHCVGCGRSKWPGKTVARRVADRKRRGLRVDASNIVSPRRYRCSDGGRV